MKNSIQGLIFDFDGTLFNSEPVHFEAYQTVLKNLGHTFSFDEYAANFLGFEDTHFFEAYFAKHRIKESPDEINKLIKLKAKIFEDLSPKVTECPDAMDFLKKVNTKYKLAICSGAYKSDIEAILNSTDDRKEIKKFFSHIVTSDDVKNPKPDPEGYLKACTLLNLKPAQCVAFEDSPIGIKAASMAGLKVIALTHSYGEETLKPLTEQVYSSFSSIEL